MPDAPIDTHRMRDSGLLARARRWLAHRRARVTALVVARPWVPLALVLLTLLPTGWLAAQLELKTSFLDLLSRDDPEAEALFAVLDRSGGLGFSTIAVPARDRAEAESVVVALEEELGSMSGVRYVDGRRDVETLELTALRRMPAAEIGSIATDLKAAIDHEVRARGGLLLDDDPRPTEAFARLADLRRRAPSNVEAFTASRDGAYLYVFVALAGSVGDLGHATDMQAETERRARAVAARLAPGLELRFSGPIVNRRDDAEVLRRDLRRAGLVGGLVVAALLGAFFRRARTVLLVLAPLGVGLVWTLAFARVAVGHFNVLSGFLVSILTGLGVEHGIHLARRLDDERALGASTRHAATTVLRTTAPAVLRASGANAAVFAVVAVAGFRGLVEFGLVACVGMLLTALAAVVVLPAAWLLVERARPSLALTNAPPRAIAMNRRTRVALAVLFALGLACSTSLVAAGSLRFRADWRELGADTPSARFDRYLTSTLATSTTQLVIALDAPADLPRVRDAVELVRRARLARGEAAHVTRVVGLDDVIPPTDPAREHAIEQLGHQLGRVRLSWIDRADERDAIERARRMAHSAPLTVESAPASLVRRFRTADGRGTMVVLETNATLDDTEAVLAWSEEVAELRSALASQGVRGALASENAVAGRIFELVLHSGPRVLAATFLVLFLVIALEQRRATRAAAIVASVGIGLLLTLGAAALLGRTLNFMNAAVLPMILGVSVDNAMHLASRLDEVGARGFALAWRQTGAAAVAASLTNLAGFGALVVAESRGLRSVAELAAIGIVATLATTTVAFPLVLEAYARRRALRTSRP